MSKEVRVAFWNVQNLFEAGAVDRGPQSEAEIDAKVDALATAIRGFFQGQGPDLLGLAEISSRRLLDMLAANLQGNYLTVWEPPALDTQTGLALLARDAAFAQLQTIAAQRPVVDARPRSLVVRCDLLRKPQPIVVVVNHWKSRMPAEVSAQFRDADDRRESARWLGDLLANSQPETCAIVLGDFNAEPWEPPFNEVGLRSVRFFSTALYASATPAYLYNTAWRLLTEPDYWEVASQPHYQEPRPKTSHGEGKWLIFDQLMVSGRALRNGPIELVEKTVEYHCQDQVTSRRTNRGALRPLPWRTAPGGGFVGTSDHFPLLAVFRL
jgi:endonuclease/exonuclease/phosphatase family metal-dependent hydrolase